jgi:molybdopterin molybdotransferase
MDKCINDISLPRETAIAGILSRCHFSPSVEEISIEKAYGRVLAGNIISLNTLPNFLASSRDGVAVFYEHFEHGMPDTSAWKEGKDYAFSHTGIGIDGDFDTVILIEQVHFNEAGHIYFEELPTEKGQMTIGAGTEIEAGELLARAGQTLTPSLLALLTKGGYTSLPVIRKPIVSFIPTGNELVPAGKPLPPLKNIDANSILMRGKLSEFGAQPIIYPICKDDPTEIYETLKDAIDRSDIVIINAGSSKGTDDQCHFVLKSIGTMLNQQVDTGPGKHTSYTVSGNVPVIGLSGPTGCCDYTCEWYVKPLIDRYLGRPITQFPTLKAKSLVDIKSTKKAVIFMLDSYIVRDEKDQFIVIPAKNIDDDRTIEGRVNCFVPLQPGCDIKAGEMVEIELRYPFRFPPKAPEVIGQAAKRPFTF